MVLALTTTLNTTLHLLLGDLRGLRTSGLGSGLLGLLLPLLLLSLGDSGLSGSISDLGLGSSLGDDRSKVGTDDTSSVLDVLPASLLGDFLRETLLVHSSVDDGPRDLSGVLALQEQGLGLGVEESEDLVCGKEGTEEWGNNDQPTALI